MQGQEYSIRDLEEISGIKAHTIRIWEKRYNLFTPNRTTTNIRFYSDDDLKKLLNISVLINKGSKISKVSGLSPEELNDHVRSTYSVRDHGSVIDSLVIDMVAFDRVSFENKINQMIDKLGFEETINKVVYPFFNKVGILWTTGVINPAQEHFISNIIRQKFFSAIDALDLAIPEPKKYLLYLPENEQHELGLLYSYYLIRKMGHTGIYLGQNVPVKDVVKTCHAANPDYLVTYLTARIDYEELVSYLKDLRSMIPGKPVLISGQQVNAYSTLPVDGVSILKTPAEFITLLKNLS